MKECKHPCCGNKCRKKKPKPKRKPIRRYSRKRQKENVTYSALRKEFLIDYPVCEAGLKGCTITATTVHHKKGRIGKNFLDVTTWLACCMGCHEIIERSPEKAKQLGLSESRLK